ncbi:EipB family protein [Bosea sp. RAC05]|uniref:EipB family protein n=1 Tax=Bosea sp. RAC05 TaxID=1842539 RepID=UPI00083E20C1|nr:DUF1849 family protein [Bosea sp. RAC05]AOG02891.1 hypothetical protein BSY19_5035 [Bosea sp. RAC05]
MRRAPIIAVVLALAVPSLARADIQPHKAIYDLVDEDGAATGGRVEYEILGNACDGWAVLQKIDIPKAGARVVTTNASWEAADGSAMRFHETTERDGQTVSRFRGQAASGSNGFAVFTDGEGGESFGQLPQGTLLPTLQTKTLLTQAKRDRSVLSSNKVFLGTSSEGALPLEITSVLSPRASTPGDHPELDGQPSWNVTSSFYEAGGRPDTGPDYTVRSIQFGNGVVQSMEITREGATARARLRSLDLYEVVECNR